MPAGTKCATLVGMVLLLARPLSAGAAEGGLGAGLPCTGDCDGNGQVAVNELVTGVNIALGRAALASCPVFDADASSTVSVGELVAAVGNSLSSCGADQIPITLSAAALAPGAMLTIGHPSIVAGRPVEATFRGVDGFVVTAGTDLTEQGAARIAVPPFVEMRSGRFASGTVTVSIAGASSAQNLFIEALPSVDADPGALTVDLLDFTIENLFAALDDVESFEEESGTDQSELIDALFAQIDILIEMSDEIFFEGRLTLQTPTGPAIIDGQHLAALDRLLVAPFVAFGTTAARVAPGAGRGTGGSPLLTRAGWADVLEQAKEWGVGGMQVLGSYVSVLAGTVGVVAVVVPGGQPIAGVAAATAVASTAVVTVGSAGVSFFGDLIIDAIRGRDVDVYRAASNAQGIVIIGVGSIALTAAGAIQWVGSTASSIGSLIYDTFFGVTGVRDFVCSTTPERRGAVPRGVSTGQFCVLTQDIRPGPTPTRTTGAVATATRTRTPTFTPTRPRTPTRTRTGIAASTPTPTRTLAQGTFVITFHSNTDGSAGVGGAGAQIQLSGSAAFPTISWGAGVGNAQQVTVGGNPGGLLYSIHSDAADDGILYPIRSPVRYGDYGIPNTIQIIGTPAPALAAGPSYIATVAPLNFTGFAASVAFRVNP